MNLFRFLVILPLAVSLGFPRDAGAQNSKENADFKLAINLYNDKLYDLALEQLKQFTNSYPSTSQGIEARFYLGLTQLRLKQFEDARLTFQTFALTYQDNPRAPEAWWNAGESYVALRNYKEAALAFERVKVFHPRSKLAPDALLRASSYFKAAGEPENARRILRVVLQEYASSSAVLSARTQLGQMYFEEGNLEQAQNELKRVIESDPSADAKAQALLILGNIYQVMRRSEQAQATYREIIAKHGNSAAVQGAYVQLGELLADAGKYDEAIGQFKKGLGSTQASDTSLVQDALIGTGDAYAANKDYANAATYYTRFITSYPANDRTPEVLWKSAIASSGVRNFARSNEFCNQILKSNAPKVLKQRAQLKLAINAVEQKNFPHATQMYATFLNQYGDDPAAPDVVWRIAELTEKEMRDPRKAASFYELLATRYPRSPLVDDAYAAGARCYEQVKEFERALQLNKELIQKYPSSDFRSQAEHHIRMIETFEMKAKDAGLEKLALLIGDVVSEKDKVGLAFKLGEIYFNDLKNYVAAAAQFTNAINSGMSDSRFVDALYLRARSYELLTLKEEKYRQPAIDGYETFLQSYSSEPRAEDAAAALFELRATSLAAAQTAYASLMATRPNFPRHEELLIRLGQLQESADSTISALATYSAIVTNYPTSASAEEAGFRLLPLLLKLGLPDSARTVGESYLTKHPAAPHTADVLTELAELALKQGDPQHASDLYRRLLDDLPYATASVKATLQLGHAYEASGDYPNAVSGYADLLNYQMNDPFAEGTPDPSLLFALGRSHHMAGNAKEAKKYLLQVLKHEPTGELAGQAYNLLGMIARAEGSLDLATTYFRQASVITPESSARRDIANLLFDSGDYADAIKQYTTLLQSTASDTDRQYYEARIIIAHLRSDELGPADKKIASFRQKYKNADQDIADFEVERGNYFFRKEDYPNARTSYNHVVDTYDETPSFPVAMYWIGKTLEATNKPQEAIAQLTKLIEEHPTSPIVSRAQLALGNLYYSAEKWDESIRHYRQIVDDSSADKYLLSFAMSNLIETYEAAGIFDAALALTRKYLEAYPNNEDSFDKRIKIGILYQRLGYNDQSVVHLQALLDEAGSDLEGEIRYYIAEANYNKGDYQQAILDFLKVPYLVTKKGKIDWTANSLYMSGQAYEKMNRYDQALQMYQQIVDRPGLDATFKAAAKKEIDRVKLVLKKSSN